MRLTTSRRPPPAGKKRQRNKHLSKSLFRKQAYCELHALDAVLRHRTGQGLEAFTPMAGPLNESVLPRTLVLHTDEASSNVSAGCWLLFRSGLRVAYTWGPYHCCWNG